MKCFQRLGYFPRGGQVPDVVVEHVRDCLALDQRTIPDTAERTAEWQRELVRERVGAVFDPERTRMVAEGAIRAAAEVKNHPPDLINVALELLVKESRELPGRGVHKPGPVCRLRLRRCPVVVRVASRSRPVEVVLGHAAGVLARLPVVRAGGAARTRRALEGA